MKIMWTKYAIGPSLRNIRRAKGITQEELGEAAGLSANAISKWESGINFPEMGCLAKLCNELKCTPNDLMWRED